MTEPTRCSHYGDGTHLFTMNLGGRMFCVCGQAEPAAPDTPQQTGADLPAEAVEAAARAINDMIDEARAALAAALPHLREQIAGEIEALPFQNGAPEFARGWNAAVSRSAAVARRLGGAR